MAGFAHPRYRSVLFMCAMFCGFFQSRSQEIRRFFFAGDERHQWIGGNPFSSAVDAYSPVPRAAFEYRIDDYYRELRRDGTTPRFVGASRSLDLRIPFASGVNVGVMAHELRLLSTARNGESQQFSYENTRRALVVTVDAPVSRHISWSAGVGGSNASTGLLGEIRTGLTVGQPGRSLSLNLERSSNSYQMGIDVTGVQGLLPLDHQQLKAEIGVGMASPGVSVSLTGNQAVLSALARSHGNQQLAFAPAGMSRGFSARAEGSLSSAGQWMVLVEANWFQGGGTFSARGSRYASLEDVRSTGHSAAAGVQFGGGSGAELVADVGWRNLSGSLGGYAESWPFVSLFDSPLSQRGNFRVNGAVDMMHVHAGGSTPAADWLAFGGGVSVLRLVPRLRVESWQAGIFGIGRKAYEDRRLSVQYVDGATVSGGFKVRLGTFHLQYALTQFIPIRLKRAALPAEARDLMESSASGGVLKSSGGQFHRIVVEYEVGR